MYQTSNLEDKNMKYWKNENGTFPLDGLNELVGLFNRIDSFKTDDSFKKKKKCFPNGGQWIVYKLIQSINTVMLCLKPFLLAKYFLTLILSFLI